MDNRPQNNIIDLRSDTLTSPSLKMLQSSLISCMGDEFYGEAHGTHRLEEYCAELFDKECALFVPSGMMANLIAIKVYAQPGDSILTHRDYYIAYFQSKPINELCGVNLNTVSYEECKGALLNIHAINSIIETTHLHAYFSPIKLIWIENTINALSGKIYPINRATEIYQYSKSKKISLHIDGARILNACVAERILPSLYAKNCDSLSLSFSKGLSAPFGAVLLGTKAFIEKAKYYKKLFGGGLHQSDFIANTCLYAIKNNIDFLQKDHEKALTIAKYLEKISELEVNSENIETNIIMFKTRNLNIESTEFCELLLKFNIKAYPWNRDTVRLITHRDISYENAVYASETIMKIAKKLKREIL